MIIRLSRKVVRAALRHQDAQRRQPCIDSRHKRLPAVKAPASPQQLPAHNTQQLWRTKQRSSPQLLNGHYRAIFGRGDLLTLRARASSSRRRSSVTSGWKEGSGCPNVHPQSFPDELQRCESLTSASHKAAHEKRTKDTTLGYGMVP